MSPRALKLVPGPSIPAALPADPVPNPTIGPPRADPWPEVSRQAKALAAAIAAEAVRMRALDGMATQATIDRVKASIPTLRRLLDELEKAI